MLKTSYVRDTSPKSAVEDLFAGTVYEAVLALGLNYDTQLERDFRMAGANHLRKI